MVRIARWRDDAGAEWVGTEHHAELTPLRRIGAGREGDAAVVALAMRRDGARDARPAGPVVALDDVALRAPITRPGAFRDAMAFEAHVATARAARGQEMDPDWYSLPVFYFTNPHTIIDPGAVVQGPATAALDYELEVGIVAGAPLRDAAPAEALDAIAGFTIYNDFSARDIQRTEMRLGLGPSKAKDFAQGLGPVLVTPDELAGTPERPQATMAARINGEETSRGDLVDLHHSVGDLLAHVSRSSLVRPGDVLGTGTVGTGCLLERNASAGPEAVATWLQPGDLVELEVEGIGVLTHRIGSHAPT